MRETNTPPVQQRWNPAINMAHVILNADDCNRLEIDPEEYDILSDVSDTRDKFQHLVWFGNTLHGHCNPEQTEFRITLDRTTYVVDMEEVKLDVLLAKAKTYMHNDTILLDHLHTFTSTWARELALNLNHENLLANAEFWFGDGNVHNLTGEGDDMCTFHVEDYQIWGWRTDLDTYRMMEWVDGDPELVGEYSTMMDCHKAYVSREREKRTGTAEERVQQYNAKVMEQVGEWLTKPKM